MLPDLRLLFAIVTLSVSVLVFGLGAAALLRTAHGNFSSLPAANLPHETNLARDQEARTTTLALLRVEMIADQNEHVASSVVPEAPEAARNENGAVSPETVTKSAKAPLPAQVDATNDAGPATQTQRIDPVSQSAVHAHPEPQPAIAATTSTTPTASETVPARAAVEPAAATQAIALAEPAASQPEQSAKASSAVTKSLSRKAHVVVRRAVKPHRIARRRPHLIAQRIMPAAPQAMQPAPLNSPFAGFGTK